MAKEKSITKAVFQAIAEVLRVGLIVFSRKSLWEKEVLIEFGCLPHHVNHALKRFRRSGYLETVHGNKLMLSSSGRARMMYYALQDVNAPSKPSRWDEKWRVLIFDIPETKKRARDLLRNKIKEWNFFQIQRSVFVTPFDCTSELDAVFDLLDIREHAHIIVAENIGSLHKNLVKHFSL